MKRIFLLFAAIAILINSFATATVNPGRPPLKASDIMIPVGKTGIKISLLDISVIKAKELEKLTGNKMNVWQKIQFKVAQKKLKDNIDRDGTINSKKLEKALKQRGGETGFHLGGFALGFLLGLIGVLIAYLIKDDFKRNRVKWAWFGWLVWLVVWAIILISGGLGI